MLFTYRGIVLTLIVNSDYLLSRMCFPRRVGFDPRPGDNGRGVYFSAKHLSSSVVITPSVHHTHLFLCQRRCTNFAVVSLVKQNT